MFCKFCGTRISDDSIFCSYCGERLTETSDREPKALTIQSETEPEEYTAQSKTEPDYTFPENISNDSASQTAYTYDSMDIFDCWQQLSTAQKVGLMFICTVVASWSAMLVLTVFFNIL